MGQYLKTGVAMFVLNFSWFRSSLAGATERRAEPHISVLVRRA